MSVFDGSDEELTYGEALCEIAQRISWQTEGHAIAALRAVQKEHGLLPPEPDRTTLYSDPRDLTLAQQDDEIAALRKKLEKAHLEAELAKAQAAGEAKASGPADTGAPSGVAPPFTGA